jgi:hypothetical protein
MSGRAGHVRLLTGRPPRSKVGLRSSLSSRRPATATRRDACKPMNECSVALPNIFVRFEKREITQAHSRWRQCLGEILARAQLLRQHQCPRVGVLFWEHLVVLMDY